MYAASALVENHPQNNKQLKTNFVNQIKGWGHISVVFGLPILFQYEGSFQIHSFVIVGKKEAGDLVFNFL